MRIGTPGFVPARLEQARAARRIKTQKELAETLGVQPSAVSRWESGESAPETETLSTLATTLNVRRDFFLRPITPSTRPMFQRAQSSNLVVDIRYQKSQMSWLQEISSVLQHYVDFPPVDIPDVLGGASWKQLRENDIERIALDLRAHWKMGEGPCGDMVALLERIGVIIGTLEMGTSRLDGLCSWSPEDERPHVILATDKMCFPRRQMDAAHELAHAVLHRNVTEEEFRDNLDEIEKQAFRLAGAFLMPSTTYHYEVERISLAQLLALKGRWRTSVGAQIRRLADLDVIDNDTKTDLYKLRSAKGWTKEEPLDREWPLSEPRTLRNSLNLLVSSGVRTKADLLAVEFIASASDIERLVGLPMGWFSEKEGMLIQLKANDRQPREVVSGGGSVLPFMHRTSK
jgi:Zn-dependent peptidase ImmA (M78 family)/DNA-binding XRE family transcriptional regulator